MKNRKTTYMLLAAVLVVWGGVGYKILRPKTNDISVVLPTARIGAPGSNNKRETLFLDYRDPFLESESPPAQAVRKTDKTALAPPVPETIEQPPFQYKGAIYERKKVYAVIAHHPAAETFVRGEIIDGYRLESISPDSITLSKGKRRYTLKIK